MTGSLTKKDTRILTILADYRTLTQEQLAIVIGETKQGPRRSLARLVELGLVESDRRNLSSQRTGRPEHVFMLTDRGAECLIEEGHLPRGVTPEQVSGRNMGRILEHQLLLNRARIHLEFLPSAIPDLTVQIIPSTSPLWMAKDGRSHIVGETVHDSDNQEQSFRPDAVFSITSKQKGRSLLFFLEVDMGTEVLRLVEGKTNTVQHKVRCYQLLFAQDAYRRYERILGTKFEGFRLLFLAATQSRFGGVCSAVMEIPLTDFVWVTDQGRMIEHGLASAIWARGGDATRPPQSILGPAMCRPSPLPVEYR